MFHIKPYSSGFIQRADHLDCDIAVCTGYMYTPLCKKFSNALGDIGAEPIFVAPSWQYDFWVIANRLGLGHQVIGIEPIQWLKPSQNEPAGNST
jgi:hypothetical protein